MCGGLARSHPSLLILLCFYIGLCVFCVLCMLCVCMVCVIYVCAYGACVCVCMWYVCSVVVSVVVCVFVVSGCGESGRRCIVCV